MKEIKRVPVFLIHSVLSDVMFSWWRSGSFPDEHSTVRRGICRKWWPICSPVTSLDAQAPQWPQGTLVIAIVVVVVVVGQGGHPALKVLESHW